MKNRKKKHILCASTLNATRSITHRKISYKFIVYNELKRYYKNHNKNEFEYYEEVMDAGGTEVATKKNLFLLKLARRNAWSVAIH